MPDLPTLAESGLPGFDATLTYGLLAPVGTPRAIVDRLKKNARALASDEVRTRIIAEGGEPEPTTPEQHAAVIDREESAVIRAAGIQAR